MITETALAGAVTTAMNVTMVGDAVGGVSNFVETMFPQIEESTQNHGENIVSKTGSFIVNGMDDIAQHVASGRDSVLAATKDMPVVGAVTHALASVGNVAGAVWTDATNLVDNFNEGINTYGAIRFGAKEVHSDRDARKHAGIEAGNSSQSLTERMASEGLFNGLLNHVMDKLDGDDKQDETAQQAALEGMSSSMQTPEQTVQVSDTYQTATPQASEPAYVM